jgi:small subunit ribosomal protein S3
MQEKQFVEKGIKRVNLEDFMEEELQGAGYSHSKIERTPTSTKIVVHAEKPGLVIGRGGSRIKELTSDLEKQFNFENPQIEVNEVENPDSDAQIVAQNMAEWLEKGGRAKRVGYTYLRRIKQTGAVGAQIEVSGKLSGNRGRTEKFSYGYVKRCGATARNQVDKGYELARTLPGAIGVKVRIMDEMPDFMQQEDQETGVQHETSSEAPGSDEDVISQIIEEAENMTSAEITRAIETMEEVEPADIDKQEVREAFENRDTSQEKDEQQGEDNDQHNYSEIVEQNISEAKESIEQIQNPDYQKVLEAEKDNKQRKTFISWIEEQQ